MTINLKPIKKGSTYSFQLKVWTDAAKTTLLNLSAYSFSLVATNAAGMAVIALADVDFVKTSSTVRTVTLSKATTATYAAGDLYYQLDVTNPDTTSDEWFDGYIQVLP